MPTVEELYDKLIAPTKAARDEKVHFAAMGRAERKSAAKDEPPMPLACIESGHSALTHCTTITSSGRIYTRCYRCKNAYEIFTS